MDPQSWQDSPELAATAYLRACLSHGICCLCKPVLGPLHQALHFVEQARASPLGLLGNLSSVLWKLLCHIVGTGHRLNNAERLAGLAHAVITRATSGQLW